MFTLKNTPQPKQAILLTSLCLYLQSFKYWLPFSLLTALCFSVPQLLILSHLAPWENTTELYSLFGACWLIALTLISAMIFRLYCFSYNIPSGFFIAIRHALFKLVPVLMQSALYILLVLGATMMLIVPGIIFAISLLFSFILVITGNQNVLQTLISSHRLVWNHWCHTFLVLSFSFLLPILAFLAVFLGNIALLPEGIIPAAFYWRFSLFNILVQALLLPFSVCATLVLFHDLRQRQTQLPRW